MATLVQSIPARQSSFWAVTFLISGTCIGGGMLALPVQTAKAGFFLTLFGLLISWGFMTLTGLLLVEATLWVKNDTHFASLSRILVGKKTRLIALLVYLFMNYTSLVGYTAGGSALISHWGKALFGLSLSHELSCLLFTLAFGSMLFLGSYFIGKINLLFMLGLALTYCSLVAFGIRYVDVTNLSFRPDVRAGMSIFSIILATFSYQMIVPSLCAQLHYDADKLKKAILLGTSLPALVYMLWIFVVHGVIPLEGSFGLLETLNRGASATEPLRMHFAHWSIALLSDFFALFAVVTSYLGLSLALFYFLKDSFSELRIQASRGMIIFSSLAPTLVLAMMFPSALVRCLDMSGGYGDTILSGLIPVSMVWMGRYKRGMKGDFTIPGGKWTLGIAALFYLTVFFIQMF